MALVAFVLPLGTSFLLGFFNLHEKGPWVDSKWLLSGFPLASYNTLYSWHQNGFRGISCYRTP